MAPTTSGIQPPSSSLSKLAPKKARSMTRKMPLASDAAQSGQCHSLRIAVNSSPVVSSIVVETAVP